MAVRVFHCDDSEAYRFLVAQWLADAHDIELVGQAEAADEAVAEVARTAPHVVLLDLRGGDLGPELIDRVRAAAPGCAVVVLSGWDGPLGAYPVAARLDKGVSSIELASAIRAAAALDE